MTFRELLLACDDSTAAPDVSPPDQSLGVGSPIPPRRGGLRSGNSTPYSGGEGRTGFGNSPKHEGTAPGSEEHLSKRGRRVNMADAKGAGIELSVFLSGDLSSSMGADSSNSPKTRLRRHPRRLSFDKETGPSKSIAAKDLGNPVKVPGTTLRSKRKDMASPRREPKPKVSRSEQGEEIAVDNIRLTRKGNTVAEPPTPPTGENFPKKSSESEVIARRAEKSTRKLEPGHMAVELLKVDYTASQEGQSGNLGKRSRGRPRKSTVVPVEENIFTSPEIKAAENVPKRRGRPKRVQMGSSNPKPSNDLIVLGVENTVLNLPLQTVEKGVAAQVAERPMKVQFGGDVEDNMRNAVPEFTSPVANMSPRRPGRPKKLPVVSLKGKKSGDIASDPSTTEVRLSVDVAEATANVTTEGTEKYGKRPRGRPRKLQNLLIEECNLTSPAAKSSNIAVTGNRPTTDDITEDSLKTQASNLLEKVSVTITLATNTMDTVPYGISSEAERANSEEVLEVDPCLLFLKDAEEAHPGENPLKAPPSATNNESGKGSACFTPEKTMKRSRGRPRKVQTAQAELKYESDGKVEEQIEDPLVSFTVGTSGRVRKRPVGRPRKSVGEEVNKLEDGSLKQGNQNARRRRVGRPRKLLFERNQDASIDTHETSMELSKGTSEDEETTPRPRPNLRKKNVVHGIGSQEQNEKVGRRRGRPMKGTKQRGGVGGNQKEAVGLRRPADGQSTGAVKGKKVMSAQDISRRRYVSKVVLDGVEFRVGEDVYVRKGGFVYSESETEVEVCQVCGETDGRTMIECDRCLDGFHLACLNPPLEVVPEDDWVCPFCTSGSKPPVKLQSKRAKQRSAREMLLEADLWAARIEKMWSEQDGTYWFKARWFLIPEETSTGRQNHTGSRELFRSSQSDDNEMDSILRHCYVMSPDEFKKSAHEGDDVFYCEYEYNERWCRFKRIDYDNESLAIEGSEDEAYNPSGESEEELDGGEERSRQPKLEKKLKQGKSPKAANKRQSFSGGIEQVGAKTVVDRPNKGPQSDYEKAKAALTLSAVPPSMPCRDLERAEIAAFLKDAVGAGEQCLGHCLYISGVPGTGKTATVREVIKDLESKVDAGELPAFRFVEINGLRLPSPDHVYTVLHEAFTGQHLAWKKALECLDDRFSSSKHLKGSDARPCVLLIDELDVLVNRNQSVLYNIFDWPSRPHSRLVVIGIANTMDLPERMLPRIASRMGLKRISFSPYSHKQLEEIIASRLEGVQIFDKQAAEFASRKVAAVSGDIRRALELCRRAVEVAEARIAEHKSSSSPEHTESLTNQVPEVIQATPRLVTMADVDAAISQLFEAPQIQMMERSSKLAKIFLTAMVCEQRRTSLVETTFEKVAATCSELCANNGEDIPDFDTLLGVGCKLGALRLLLCEPGARHKLQKLQLNFPCDDVSFALKKDSGVPWLANYL